LAVIALTLGALACALPVAIVVAGFYIAYKEA
jgi:hypothetical protein